MGSHLACRPFFFMAMESAFSQIIRIFADMKHMILSLLAWLGLCPCAAQDTVRVLAPKDFRAAMQADTTALLLDVRTPSEFAEGHLAGAVNLDWLNQTAFAQGANDLDTLHTYYIYCRSGRRSHAAALRLQHDGLRVVDMKGGILLWKEQQLPVVVDAVAPGAASPILSAGRKDD